MELFLPLLLAVLISRAETEARVRKDLAARLKVDEAAITVVSVVERVWDDAGLGCRSRKGLREPAPVPGYALTLAEGDKEYVYHSDRHGRFRRCDPPPRPTSPRER